MQQIMDIFQRNKKLIMIAGGAIIAVIIVFIIIMKLAISNGSGSNENQFLKYVTQNFKLAEQLTNVKDISNVLDKIQNAKYTSEIKGKLYYTENVNTSSENRNNPVNKVGITINSNIDNANNYQYRSVRVGTDETDYIKMEFLKEDNKSGYRQKGIQQFVSSSDVNGTETNSFSLLSKQYNETIDSLINIFNFSETEKKQLMDTYSKIIKENIPGDKYSKQSNSLITVDGKDVRADEYYVKMTSEEWKNLIIKILEKMSADETILSRIDRLENEFKKENNDINNNSMRNSLVEAINGMIESTRNLENFGDIRISVFVADNKLVRTTIEKGMEKTIIELNSDTKFTISHTEFGDTNKEIKIIVDLNSEGESSIEYTALENDTLINKISINYEEQINDNSIYLRIKLKVANAKNECLADLTDNISLVNEFENKVTTEQDYVDMQTLSTEQQKLIKEILDKNIQEQINELNSVVTPTDYMMMFAKLFTNSDDAIQNFNQYNNGQTASQIEQKRFNSQFEFFESKDLNTDNMKQLLETAKPNLSDIKIILKNGDATTLDVDMLYTRGDRLKEYLGSFSEILFEVAPNTTNEKRAKDFAEFLKLNSNYKYDITLQYGNDGLVNVVSAKIKEQ